MMSKEKAVEVMIGRCESMARKIKKSEYRRRMTDVYGRRFLGAYRTLLIEVGCDVNLIPDEPYLKPEYQTNYQKWYQDKCASGGNVTIVDED